MLKKLLRKHYQKKYNEASDNAYEAARMLGEYMGEKAETAEEFGFEMANNMYDILIEHQQQVMNYYLQIECKWHNKVMSTYKTRSF